MTALASFLLVAQIVPALAELPVLDPNVQSHYVSSYDRSGGNDDGFNGTFSALYVDDAGEHVLLDATGPGTLWNLWFTSRVNGRSPLGLRSHPFLSGRRRRHLRIDMDVDELFSGRYAPFVSSVRLSRVSEHRRLRVLPADTILEAAEDYDRTAGGLLQRLLPDLLRRTGAVTSWTGEEDLSRASAGLWSLEGSGPDGGPELDAPTELHTGRFAIPAPEMPDGEPRYFTEPILGARRSRA